MNDMTPRQAEVVAFINRHRASEQCNPTCNEIAQHFGWSSQNAADDHLYALERKGVIMRRPGKARGYVVLRHYVDLGAA